MRDEKEGRKKQARLNKQTTQSNAAHPRQSLFLSCLRVMYTIHLYRVWLHAVKCMVVIPDLEVAITVSPDLEVASPGLDVATTVSPDLEVASPDLEVAITVSPACIWC